MPFEYDILNHNKEGGINASSFLLSKDFANAERQHLTEYAVGDRIIDHLKLSFVADRPPPPQIASQELLMATDPPAEYFS
jgi:hypothetical protein